MNSKCLISGLILLAFLFSFSNCKKENQLPSCTITYPNNGDEFEQGDTISISVEANDNDGLIAEVNFYIDDIGTFSSSSFPYGYSWNTLDETIGNHIIKVIAKDNEGGSKTNECTISIIGNATVVTTEASSITHNSAMSGGNITNDGGTSILERGICWNTSQNPTLSNEHTTDGNGTSSFTSTMTGLSPNTIYYVRAYSINSVGISYGNEINLITLKSVPVITTDSVNLILARSVLVFGSITHNGGATVTARGVCWNMNQNPSLDNNIGYTNDGNGTGSFTSYINELQPNTTYFARTYATNSVGTAHGNEVSFTTTDIEIGPIIDYDGNAYDTVNIGNQVWMAENLKVTHFPDGTPVQLMLVKNNSYYDPLGVVSSLEPSDKVYFYYDNDTANSNTYGVLYTWQAAKDVCPDGWHLPNDDEWKELEMYFGMSQSEADDQGWRGTDEGGKLKETGTTHWLNPNTGATNESDFSALPGGQVNGREFNFIGQFGRWWSSTQYSTAYAWTRRLIYDRSTVYRTNGLGWESGLSVRCIKD
jgi:uncharacterized protein (TIGR02145 family)